MAYTFDPAVKAALQAALPNQALTNSQFTQGGGRGGYDPVSGFGLSEADLVAAATNNDPNRANYQVRSYDNTRNDIRMYPGSENFVSGMFGTARQGVAPISTTQTGTGALGGYNEMLRDFRSYWNADNVGSEIDFAGGKLRRVGKDKAVYTRPDGQNVVLNSGTAFETFARAAPTVAQLWQRDYGYQLPAAAPPPPSGDGTFTAGGSNRGGVQNDPQYQNRIDAPENQFYIKQQQQLFNNNQNLGNSILGGVAGNKPNFGNGIGGMISGMQSQSMPGINIPGMAQVPEFNMPTQPSFNPNQYQANPYLSQIGNSITSQVTENLQRNIMPNLRSGVQAAGGFGGSRQGVLEANALKDANKNISDSLTGMYFGDYTNAMNRNLQRYGMDQNFNMGLGQLGLNAQNAARNYNLGVGQLALGNQNSLQNFYSINRGQDLAQTQLGASLLNMGNTGMLSQGQGLYGLGQTQQQAPWNVVNAGNAGFGQWSGYGTTTSANQGSGLQGALGGAMAGGQLGNLWGNTGSTSLVGMRPTLESYYGY